MHVYIYDSFLANKKYDRTLARIETRLTDLGLNGKINRLGIMKNIPDIISGELKRGAKTIIAVGNDNTVSQVINSLVAAGMPLGIIPIGRDNNLIADALGIDHEEACNILSARRIAKLDLGLANHAYFLTQAAITNQNTVIEISEDYSIEIMKPGQVQLVNLARADTELPAQRRADPQDGRLELLIKTKESKNFLKQITGQSVFSFHKLTIRNPQQKLKLDDIMEISPPAVISVVKQALNVIVGKNRTF